MKKGLARDKGWSYSRISMLVFGGMAFVSGVVGLWAPRLLLASMGFSESVVTAESKSPFLIASSMAALNMGVYYMLAARANVVAFFRWTVPFRILTCVIFIGSALRGTAPMPFLGVGATEGLGALITGLALWREGEYKKGFL